MTKIVATLAAAALLLTSQTPAFASDRGKEVKPVQRIHTNVGHGKSHHNGAKVAIGIAIGAGIVGALIASRHHNADKPHYGTTYVSAPSDGLCRIWRADCRYGSERACYKYENRC
jgi:hypothetical protein